jgi:hypothetical protein
MTHLLVLVILWVTYMVARLVLRAEYNATPTPSSAPSPWVGAERGGEPVEAATWGGLAWSAVDDRQLTRLLRSSAARATRTGKRA